MKTHTAPDSLKEHGQTHFSHKGGGAVLVLALQPASSMNLHYLVL